MVKVTFFQNKTRDLVGFSCIDHADYSEDQDIVCAGVSALVINCINSVEELTDDKFTCESDGESGRIDFSLCEGFGGKSQLLLRSLALGLEKMESRYEENLDLIFEEV